MKDELVSIKVAKLAFNKGFIEECSDLYHKVLIREEYNNNAINDKGIYSAPTQSLLQRWLRNVHNISVTVNDNLIDDFKLKFDVAVYDVKSESNRRYSYYPSYETALEIGLYKALKLIKT